MSGNSVIYPRIANITASDSPTCVIDAIYPLNLTDTFFMKNLPFVPLCEAIFFVYENYCVLVPKSFVDSNF